MSALLKFRKLNAATPTPAEPAYKGDLSVAIVVKHVNQAGAQATSVTFEDGRTAWMPRSAIKSVAADGDRGVVILEVDLGVADGLNLYPYRLDTTDRRVK